MPREGTAEEIDEGKGRWDRGRSERMLENAEKIDERKRPDGSG
jgi:hypothetical protein